jgi:hypothetical protein
MRKVLAFGVLFGLMAFIASDANAQRFGFGGGGNLILLQNKGVQGELKLTDDQKDKLKATADEFGPKMFEIFQKGKDLSKEDREAKIKEIQDAANKEVKTILKAEQMKRLTQISRQQDVLRTLTTDEDVTKALKFSDEQKEKLKGISDDVRKDMQELFQGFKKDGGTDFTEMQSKMTALRKEGKEKALKVLTDEQKTTWKELTGDPFEVKFDGFGKKKKDD